MKLKPIITERSLSEAKKGNYTFFVDRNLTKFQIKNLVSQVFGVTVTKVRTINKIGEHKRNYQGKKRYIKPQKKAMVTLKEKDKIDLFEEVK